MQLSAKSSAFLNKILKHHPIPTKPYEAAETDKPYLHLHDHRKIYERPTTYKLANMEMFKNEGNNHYTNGRFAEAGTCYQKVIVYGDYTFPKEPAQVKYMELLLQQANCNMAICLIKTQQWSSARSYLNQTIKGSNEDICKKGYYWLCKMHLHQEYLHEAEGIIPKLELKGAQGYVLKELRHYVSQLRAKSTLKPAESTKNDNNNSKKSYISYTNITKK